MIEDMPLAVAAFVLACPALADAPTLTLRQTGTVSSLIKEISNQSKVNLEVDRLGREILIVSLQDALLGEAMERIAWATFGRWEKTSTGYRLVGDTGQQKKAEREYVERAANVAAVSIARFRKGVLTAGSDPDVAKATFSLRPDLGSGGATAPEARLLARLLGSVDPRNLVSLTPDGQTVHATNPTPAEFRFGFEGDIAPILSRYAAEKGWASISEQPIRVMLKGNCRPEGGYAALELFVSFKGKWEHRTVNTRIEFQPANPETRLPKELVNAIPDTTPIPLSEVSQSMVFQGEPGSPPFPTPRVYAQHPDLIKRLREPERFEPLSTFTADTWLAAGQITRRNVVANVDDVLLTPYYNHPLPTLREALHITGRLNTRYESGWLAVRPQLWNAPWGHRVDRAALGRYVSSNAKSGELASLDATAAFLNGAGSTIPRGISHYLDWASEGRLGGWDEYGGQSLYLERFYATLPDATRRAWKEGTPIDVATLPKTSHVALRNWAIARNYEGPRQGQILNPPVMEPTVSFPNGEATQGWLRATIQSEPGFAVRYPFEDGTRSLWFTEQGLANWLNNVNPDRKRILVQAAARRIVRLSADLPEGQPSTWRTWRDPQIDPAKFVPWSQARDISGRFGD